MTRQRRLVGASTRRAAHFLVAAATACGVLTLAPVIAASSASAATQTALSETGWVASSNTNSSAGDSPQNAVSGDTGARFSSDADQASGMWWQVNLGSAQSFDQIEMDSGGYAGDYAHGYEVEVSSDGTNFTTVFTGTGTANPETATFTTQTAQYIRVQLTTAVSTNWWSMVNFTAYTSGSGGSGGSGGGTSGQLSETGWTASSNTNSPAGDAPQHAISGNTGARFSSEAYQAPGIWWQADMGSVQTFNQVSLDSGANTGDYARGYDVEVSNDGTKFTPVYFGTGTASPESATFSTQQARYIRILLTASSTTSWWSLTNVTVSNSSTSSTLPAAPATGGSLGSNVYVFTPSESVASILSTVNTISNAQVGNQFGNQRYELLFEPGTYGSASNPLVFTVGYYESVAGLGQNPGQVVINGAINSYNQCNGGVQTQCYATDNFWRAVSNLTINVTGMTGCFNGTDVWAVSQAAPMRRVQINGNLTLMDYCDGSPDWASGGFIADSKLPTVTNGSQQQFFVRNSSMSSWGNGVWDQVFCGDPGAPAQSFAANSGDSGGPNPYTTLASCPTTQESPYLYTDSSGNYNVFVPSAQSNSNGPSWANGNTPGSSLSLNSFYVVNSSSTVDQINAALAAGDNLLFTPGVYQYAQTIQVTHANTKILGLGFATLIPTSGNVAVSVADVPGVNVSGLIFDAGPTQSSALLQLGTEGSTANNASNPDSVDDVFFRVGGAEAGTVATAFVDNSNNSVIDDVWSWRADHGAGAGGWTGDQSATGLVVNGDNVEANGLAVEHYQQYETIWNGQGGKVVFFQNENPYEVPSQAAWMSSATQNGYPAFYVPNSVTTFTGYGMGSYSYFSQGVAIENAMAFQAPQTSGVQFNDILTVFLNGSGGIQSVIDGTGAAVSPSFGGPSDVVSFN